MADGTRHAAIIDSRYSVSDVTYPRPKQNTPQPTYMRSRPKSARERVVMYMQTHPRITFKQLLVAAGIREENVKSREALSLVYELTKNRIYQTSSDGFDSVFELQPTRDPEVPS